MSCPSSPGSAPCCCSTRAAPLAHQEGRYAGALRHFNEAIAGGMGLRPLLARIDAPTLVITGALDPFGEATARELADALPHPALAVLPGADHFPFLEDGSRAAWAEAVLDFLRAPTPL